MKTFEFTIERFLNNFSKVQFYKAFTLAEVLIVLAIIGVIASLTIPTMVQKTQNLEHVVGLKKFYSTFNQSLKTLTEEYGCLDDLKCTGIFDSSSEPGDVLVKYIKVAKNCKTDTNKGCWAKTNPYYDGKATYIDNFDNSSMYYKFITADGMSVALYNNGNNCEPDIMMGMGNFTGYMTARCGQVYVDVNGPKGPNIEGRDTFGFQISNSKGAILYPIGGADSPDESWNNLCNGTQKFGMNCTGRIMEKSWAMDY